MALPFGVLTAYDMDHSIYTEWIYILRSINSASLVDDNIYATVLGDIVT